MIVIFTALGGACVVFLLYVLYQFRREDLCTRDAGVRALRSVVAEENPEVTPMNSSRSQKFGDTHKLLVIRLEPSHGTAGIRPFAGLSSPQATDAQEGGFPDDEDPETQEEG